LVCLQSGRQSDEIPIMIITVSGVMQAGLFHCPQCPLRAYFPDFFQTLETSGDIKNGTVEEK
jgi:hypothetical protein